VERVGGAKARPVRNLVDCKVGGLQQLAAQIDPLRSSQRNGPRVRAGRRRSASATQLSMSPRLFQAIVTTPHSARIRSYMVRFCRHDDLIAASRHAGSTAGRGSYWGLSVRVMSSGSGMLALIALQGGLEMRISRRLTIAVSGLALAAGSFFALGAATPASAATTTDATQMAVVTSAHSSGYGHGYGHRGYGHRGYGYGGYGGYGYGYGGYGYGGHGYGGGHGGYGGGHGGYGGGHGGGGNGGGHGGGGNGGGHGGGGNGGGHGGGGNGGGGH
jgi:hypothetical protein